MISHSCNFDNTSKEIIENKKKAPKLKSFHMEASYVQWLVGKMINWQYHKLEKKTFTNSPISYEDQWLSTKMIMPHGHLHGILHENMTIFGTNMGVTIVIKNFTKWLKIWLIKCIFSIFLVPSMTFFVKQVP